jgi:alpha-tubulin suppressor-like RCC1 family protein
LSGSTTTFLENSGVFAWGNNSRGQLGLANKISRILPEEVKLPNLLRNKKIESLSCGLEHTLLVADNGDLLACGSNEHGQLGTPMGVTYNS